MPVSELFVSHVERHPAPQMGDLKCGEEAHSCYTYICQLASAELVSLSLCLIWQSWLIFSSSQCHCHLCCDILWMNKNVQLCLKQLFGEKKHMYRKMVSCESSSQTTWHWMAQTEGSPNIRWWNVTGRLNCMANWGQLNKMHFKVSVLKYISFKTKYNSFIEYLRKHWFLLKTSGSWLLLRWKWILRVIWWPKDLITLWIC